MRQALTAKGQLDAWMRSSEAALTNMGVEDIMVDENSLHIEGKHPEHGPIGIDYMIPEQGKTRMVIQVDDPQMITAFKRAVTPVFKNVIKELQKLEAEQAESQAPETEAEEAPAEEATAAEPEAAEAETVPEAEPEGLRYEAPEKETEAAETAAAPPKKAKKGKGGLIALIIILIVVAAAAASYFLYFRNHGGIPFLSKSTTSSSTQSSNSSSKKSTSGSSSSAGTASSTDSSTASNTNNTANTTQDATAQAGTITQAQYNQINNGMTYDQVKQLIGSDGTKLSESTYKDAQGNTINVQIYYWKGNGSSDSNANITFQGGAVASKSSYGLK
ncbi:MAG: hypothetical protein ACI39G_03525 [Pseudoramibacter sp.]